MEKWSKSGQKRRIKNPKPLFFRCLGLCVVPRTGLEPVHPEVLVFETNASTNSAIWAFAGAKLQKIIEPRKFFYAFRKRSASRAALQPVPAATMAWR